MKKIMGILACLVLSSGMALALPANTNIAVWYPATGTPKTYIDGVGWIHAPYMVVDTQVVSAVTMAGNATVGGTLDVAGTSELGGNVTCLDDFEVKTNSTLDGTLDVLGVATFKGTSVAVLDDLSVGTNATVGGTLGVTGVATFKGTSVAVLDDLTVGTNVTVSGLTASKPVFTDGSKVLSSTAVERSLAASTLTDGGITTACFAANAVTGDKVADGTISNADLGIDIDPAKLQAGGTASAFSGISITNIPGTNLLNLSIADGKISDVAGGKITGVRTISGDKITDNTITNATLATGIDAAKMIGNAPSAILTNACGAGATLIAVTNRGVGYTNVITFFGAFSGTVEPSP